MESGPGGVETQREASHFPQVCSMPSPDKSQQLVVRTEGCQLVLPSLSCSSLSRPSAGRDKLQDPEPQVTPLDPDTEGQEGGFQPLYLNSQHHQDGRSHSLVPCRLVPRHHLKTKGPWEVLEGW